MTRNEKHIVLRLETILLKIAILEHIIEDGARKTTMTQNVFGDAMKQIQVLKKEVTACREYYDDIPSQISKLK